MKPADPDFIEWWRRFVRIQSGTASLADVFMASFHWKLSMELQKRLGNLD